MKLVGASHVVRAKSYARNGYLKDRGGSYAGKGGVPIYNSIFEAGKEACQEVRKVALLPDPRFGNEVVSLNESMGVDAGSFFENFEQSLLDKFRNVKKEFILESNDRFLFDIYIRKLEEMQSLYDVLIPWCLFGRETINKKVGRHMVNGAYRHPVWNLSDFRAYDAVVDLESLTFDENSLSLWVDNNIHPSFKGFLFLDYLSNGCSPESALTKVMKTDEKIDSCFSSCCGNIYVLGGAKYLRSILNLVKVNAIHSPVNLVHISSDEAFEVLDDGALVLEFVEIDSNNEHQVRESVRARSGYSNYKCVFYSTFYYEYILSRDGLKVSKKPMIDYADLEKNFNSAVKLSTIPKSEVDSCFELNRKKLFTQKFFFYLLKIVFNRSLKESDIEEWAALRDDS